MGKNEPELPEKYPHVPSEAAMSVPSVFWVSCLRRSSIRLGPSVGSGINVSMRTSRGSAMRVAAGRSWLRTREEAAEKRRINKSECLNIVKIRLLCMIKECTTEENSRTEREKE